MLQFDLTSFSASTHKGSSGKRIVGIWRLSNALTEHLLMRRVFSGDNATNLPIIEMATFDASRLRRDSFGRSLERTVATKTIFPFFGTRGGIWNRAFRVDR
jgi:hypothetical protein